MSVPDVVRALIVCPLCRGDLRDVARGLICDACDRVYLVDDGIPILLPDLAVAPRDDERRTK